MLNRTDSFSSPAWAGLMGLGMGLAANRHAVGRGLRATAVACTVSAAASVSAQMPPAQWGPNVAPGSLREWVGQPHSMSGNEGGHRMSEDDRQQLRRQLIERERRRRAAQNVMPVADEPAPPPRLPHGPR